MQEVKLYRKNVLGIGTWRILRVGDMLQYSHCVVQGAAEVHHFDKIETNGSGRSLDAQIQLEMNARISRQRDKGYKDTAAEAMKGATNQLGFVSPMLAHPINKVPSLTINEARPAYVQPKFDGHRCLITNHEGVIIAYTRKGKLIESVPHITQDFAWLPEGKTVDGELYIHGRPLQAISSLIKRVQIGSLDLQFHWYDYISDHHFDQRYARMKHCMTAYPMQSVRLVRTDRVISIGEVYELFRTYKKQGYEGAMLRQATNGYQDGVRASQLLKVKSREDCEVTVLGAVPSRNGWAVLHVVMDSGKEFDISAPGEVSEKQEVMDNIASYIGRKLTVEYANLTADGIPFHSVAIRWQEDL